MQLAGFRSLHVLTQPQDRGTGLGLVLPLAWIRSRDPNALLIESPSDHFVPNLRPFVQGMRVALDGAREGRLVVLGVRAEWAETGYGWIVRGSEVSPDVCAVQAFVEKPSPAGADELRASGALWNTFVFAATVEGPWEVVEKHLPAQSLALDGYFGADAGPAALARLYDTMQPADFSRDVLQCASNLGVVQVIDSGWSDWGTPERVFASLAGTVKLQRLKARLALPSDALALSR